MSRGKKKRQRQERRAQAKPAESPKAAAPEKKPERPNPYFWNGDMLVHRDGHTVAHASEFPALHRMHEHRRRMDVMAAFHRGEPPYAPPKPELVLP